jgi:hypothetical protein
MKIRSVSVAVVLAGGLALAAFGCEEKKPAPVTPKPPTAPTAPTGMPPAPTAPTAPTAATGH